MYLYLGICVYVNSFGKCILFVCIYMSALLVKFWGENKLLSRFTNHSYTYTHTLSQTLHIEYLLL